MDHYEGDDKAFDRAVKPLVLAAVAVGVFLLAISLRPARAEDAPPKLTIGECLNVLAGLRGLDSQQIVVNRGKPGEAIANIAYEFQNGRLRSDIARNIASLNVIEKQSQETDREIIKEIATPGHDLASWNDKPNSPEFIEFARQRTEALARPCEATLMRIKFAELKADKNEIPGTVLAAMGKILDY